MNAWAIFEEHFNEQYRLYMYCAISLKLTPPILFVFRDMFLTKTILFYSLRKFLSQNRKLTESGQLIWFADGLLTHKNDRFCNILVKPPGIRGVVYGWEYEHPTVTRAHPLVVSKTRFIVAIFEALK